MSPFLLAVYWLFSRFGKPENAKQEHRDTVVSGIFFDRSASAGRADCEKWEKEINERVAPLYGL